MIKLLKQTLVGTGALLVTAVSLFIFASPVENFVHSILQSKETISNPPVSKVKTNLRWEIIILIIIHVWLNLQHITNTCLVNAFYSKQELLRLPAEVIKDDELAAAAAAAADGRPVYCRDRFYRVLAGGQYCKWDDLLN